MRWLVIPALVACGCGRVAFELVTQSADDAGVGDTIAVDTLAVDAGLPAGLIAWFPLDDIAGDIAIDRMGQSGTCTQCPAVAAGRVGTALRFDGIDDCITVPDTGHLQVTHITIALWAFQTVSRNMSHLGKPVLTGSTNSWQLEADYLNMNELGLAFTHYEASVNQFAATPDNSIQLSTWQHLAATFDGTTKRVYIDGVELASMPATAFQYDGRPLKVGCDSNADVDVLFFAGSLDELQIYDRALGQAEIEQLVAR